MTASEILMAEHRVIEQMLGCLDRMADAAFEGRPLDLADARDAIAFLRAFADAFHHKKEEDRLFPVMERHGIPRDAGPTAVMRHEHEVGRAHVRRMDEALTAHEKGDREALGRFAFEARGFTELLRDHIAKEDQVLFPMAERMIPPAAMRDLLASFDHAERHEVAPGTRETSLAAAERLGAKYGVARPSAPDHSACPSCAHGD